MENGEFICILQASFKILFCYTNTIQYLNVINICVMIHH